jgi:pimeloyl-ACP methyl ester carboxylesterase
VRSFLTKLAYNAHGWNLGVNIGPTKRLLNGVADRLIELSDKSGQVSIVGFSMGGLFARWLAQTMPERVRQVITVCSPIHDPARNFWLPLGPFLRVWGSHDLGKLVEEVARPLPVPCTALYSRDDGLVNWPACLDPACPRDCIEISGRHVLIEQNAQVMSIFAGRLARPLSE